MLFTVHLFSNSFVKQIWEYYKIRVIFPLTNIFTLVHKKYPFKTICICKRKTFFIPLSFFFDPWTKLILKNNLNSQYICFLWKTNTYSPFPWKAARTQMWQFTWEIISGEMCPVKFSPLFVLSLRFLIIFSKLNILFK